MTWNQDFNDADQQLYDLIPANTIVPVVMTVRPGGKGDGNWFKESNDGNSLMLDCEFTVSGGPYARRKFWKLFVISAKDGKRDESGNIIAVNISRATIRAILESARGIQPTDFSEEAKKARMISSPMDLDGLEFVCKVLVEKGTQGYADKNGLGVVITPDKKEYAEIKAGNFAAPAPKNAPAPGGTPAWAGQGQQALDQTNAAPSNNAPPAQGKSPTVPSWAQ